MMSRSFTTRPSIARGAGRQTDRRTNLTAELPTESEGQDVSPERVQRRDAYTMFVPNPERRHQITEAAEKETAAYNKYKAQRRPGPVSYIGTVGSGLIPSNSTAGPSTASQSRPGRGRTGARVADGGGVTRRAAVHQPRTAAAPARGRGAYRTTVAGSSRTTSQRTTTRQTNFLPEEDRQKKLQEDHKQKNEEFLNKLQNQKKTVKT